jgi:hypothetical protein
VEVDSLLLDVASNLSDPLLANSYGAQMYALIFRVSNVVAQMRANSRPVEMIELRATLRWLPPQLQLLHTLWLSHLRCDTDIPIRTFECIDDNSFWSEYRQVLPAAVFISAGIDSTHALPSKDKSRAPIATSHLRSWNDADLSCAIGTCDQLVHLYEVYIFQLLLGREAVKVFRGTEAALHRSTLKAFQLKPNPNFSRERVRYLHQQIAKAWRKQFALPASADSSSIAIVNENAAMSDLNALQAELTTLQTGEFAPSPLCTRFVLAVLGVCNTVRLMTPTNAAVSCATVQALLIHVLLLEEGSVQQQNMTETGGPLAVSHPLPELLSMISGMAQVAPMVLRLLTQGSALIPADSKVSASAAVTVASDANVKMQLHLGAHDRTWLNAFNGRILSRVQSRLEHAVANLTRQQQNMLAAAWRVISAVNQHAQQPAITDTTESENDFNHSSKDAFSTPPPAMHMQLPSHLTVFSPTTNDGASLKLLCLTPALNAFQSNIRLTQSVTKVMDNNKHRGTHSRSSAQSVVIHASKLDAPQAPVYKEMRHWHSGRLLDDGLTRTDNEDASSSQLCNIHSNPVEAHFSFAALKVLRRQLFHWRQVFGLGCKGTAEYVHQCDWMKYLKGKDRSVVHILAWFESEALFRHAKAMRKNKQKSNLWMQHYSDSLKGNSQTNMRDVLNSDETDPHVHSQGMAAAAAATSAEPARLSKSEQYKRSQEEKAARKAGKPIPNRETDKMRSIRAANQAEMDDKELVKVQSAVKHFSDRDTYTLSEAITRLETMVAPLPPGQPALLALITLVGWHCQRWKDECRTGESGCSAAAAAAKFYNDNELSFTTPYTSAALLYQHLADLLRRFMRILKVEHMTLISTVFTLLGFHCAFPQVEARWREMTKITTPLSTKSSTSIHPTSFDLSRTRLDTHGMCIADFQLLHAGQLMVRNLQSRYDARIGDAFFPDAWQRNMLDIIDKCESALVVGPTSAGKTVISMYCITAMHNLNRQHEIDKVAANAKVKGKVAKKAADASASASAASAVPAIVPAGFPHKIMVYVSPTKSLVNQVAAEVYLRTGRQPAIFTREQRPQNLNYEVLVTVPQCFEILLLSPLRTAWCARIGVVIFDEVHCLDNVDGGVWERCIVLASRLCPIIANSATIGQPEQFHAWLQQLHPRKIHLVRDQPTKGIGLGANSNTKHEQRLIRWAHLKPFIHLPSEDRVSNSAAAAVESSVTRLSAVVAHTCTLIPVHPVACFANQSVSSVFGVDRIRMVTDFGAPWPVPSALLTLTFSSRECHELCTNLSTIVQHCSDALSQLRSTGIDLPAILSAGWIQLTSQMAALIPKVYFGSSDITRLNVLCWEDHLKQYWCKLHQFAEQSHTLKLPPPIHGAIASLHRSLADLHTRPMNDGGLGLPPSLTTRVLRNLKCQGRQRNSAELLRVLFQLRDKDALPAIVFCFERAGCEVVVREITNMLLQAERAERIASGELARMEADFQQFALPPNHVIQLSELISDLRQLGDPDGSVPLLEEKLRQHYRVTRGFEADPKYTFAVRGLHLFPVRAEAGKPMEKRDFWLARLMNRRPRFHMNYFLMLALERGIAVHHSGLAKEYLDLVEVLFRKRKLTVIVATGTLAMGINMPTRTTVFFGDSSYLTPVQYRQMSGRAGRRGYDVEGRVVFVGIPVAKITRLLAVALFPLVGHMHFSPPTLLRYLILMHDTKESDVRDHTLNTLQTLLTNTLLESGAVVHRRGTSGLSLPERHYSACLELLFRLGLINNQTQPIGLAGLVSHLSYHQPANLALAHLLQSGSLARCIAHAEKVGGLEVAGRRLMMILCHLFNQVSYP